MSDDAQPKGIHMYAAVRCDREGCEWRKELPFEDIPRWLHRACPVCLFSPIVSDGDMELWTAIKKRLDRWDELSEDEREVIRTLHLDTNNSPRETSPSIESNRSNSDDQKTPNP